MIIIQQLLFNSKILCEQYCIISRFIFTICTSNDKDEEKQIERKKCRLLVCFMVVCGYSW